MNELGQAVGQLFVGGFPGEEVHQEFADLVKDGLAGGAIVFRRNLTGVEQAARLARSLLSLPSPSRLMLAIDQEGGRVQRLFDPFPELPPMRVFGDAKKKSLAIRAGRLIGESLALVGFQQNYAPVLDVDSNPANPVIGDRSFSRDPSLCARLGAAYIEGLQSAGVAACGKHFPGHGDTSEDSHLQLPALPHDLARLESVELVPFRGAVRTGVAAIMTAHIMFPALDAEHPATLSERVLSAILRRELGYDGVIVSDDLEMKAIADHYGIPDAAVRAIRAGCDQLLVCHHPALIVEAHRAIVSAVERGVLERARVMEAAARVRRLKESYPALASLPPPEDVAGLFPREEHATILAALRDGATAPSFDPGGPTGSSDRITEYDFEDQGAPLELDLDPTESWRRKT
jgi:beta-N-acetylhexosaminidase